MSSVPTFLSGGATWNSNSKQRKNDTTPAKQKPHNNATTMKEPPCTKNSEVRNSGSPSVSDIISEGNAGTSNSKSRPNDAFVECQNQTDRHNVDEETKINNFLDSKGRPCEKNANGS